MRGSAPEDSPDSPLLLAAAKGHTAVLTVLLEAKASLEEPRAQGEDPFYSTLFACNALLSACQNGHRDAAEVRLQAGCQTSTPGLMGRRVHLGVCLGRNARLGQYVGSLG